MMLKTKQYAKQNNTQTLGYSACTHKTQHAACNIVRINAAVHMILLGMVILDIKVENYKREFFLF